MLAKNIKLVIKVLLITVALLLLLFAFIPEPVKVDIFEVSQGELVVTIEGEGKTRIHDIYTVSTPIEGRITRIEREPGDIIVAGETIIANMYPANPRFLDKRSETQAKADVEGATAGLALAKARVKQIQAQLEFDLADLKRTQELFDKNNVSQARLERSQLRLKTLQAELETAQSNQEVMLSRLQAAKAKLLQPDKNISLLDSAGNHCQLCIHSPVNGRVLRILHKSEGIVPAGTALVEVGDPADLEVNIEMLSTNAVKVKVGNEAIIKRWGGNQDIQAKVRLIEPSGFTKISALGIEEQRVNVILDFVEPWEKRKNLGDAFRVEAAIVIERFANVIKVPLAALFRQSENWSVFKVVEGQAVLQVVEVGARNERVAEIKSGLVVGDKIVSYPGNNVEVGTRVEQR